MTIRRLGLRLRSLRPRALILSEVASLWGDLHGDRAAIDQDDVGAFTYAGLSAHVDKLAGGLHASGLPQGGAVIVAARNGIPLFAGVLAASRAGALPVPVNPLLRPAEVAAIAQETGAVAVVVDDTTEGLSPRGLDIVNLDRLPDGLPPAMPSVQPDDVAAVFATSGTTGRSKGAELTHQGLLGLPLASGATGGLIGWGVAQALPVSHIMGFTALLGALGSGLHVHMIERFHPVRFLEEVAALHPEVIIAVPAMYRMMLDADGGPSPEDALRSVRVFVSGSDVMPPGLAERLRRLGARGAIVFEGYGMVELSGAASMRVHLPFIGAVPRGDLGLPVPPYRLRVVDANGRLMRPFRIGELEVKGPGVLAGYRNRPDASAEVMRNGWLRTGDLASWGPFGIRFAGRSKDVLKVGGYSVYPREVEDELRACPDVSDVAVVGLPDAVMGEVIAAAVERVAGSDLDADDVLAFCREAVAGFRRPARVVVVDDLPRNPNRKVVKDEVRALFS